jgi:membrane protease YdiL (CAAX protease family)
MMESNNIIINNKKPLLKGWIRALLIIIPWFISVAVFQLIGYWLLGLDVQTQLTDGQMAIMQGISVAVTFIVVFIFTRYLDRRSFKSVGFQMKGYEEDIFLGIAVGTVIMSLGFLILLSLNEINVTGSDFDLCKLLTGIAVFVFVAFNEEIFMRGYILNNFLQSMNKYLALVLSSLIFSLFHIFNSHFDVMSFVSILLAGILLGISYIYTKNLWFPIALHFSWNFFQGTIFGFEVSGKSMYSVINQNLAENNILNGGEFGFEGSIIAQIFIVITTLLIWFARKKYCQV